LKKARNGEGIYGISQQLFTEENVERANLLGRMNDPGL
jgi:hypothetical protein